METLAPFSKSKSTLRKTWLNLEPRHVYNDRGGPNSIAWFRSVMCTAYVARARLVRKLTTWNSAVHREFAWECIAHGRDVVREALRRAGHLPEADLMSVATGLLDTYSWGIGSVSTELASAVGILGEAVSDLHAGQANLATYQCSLAVGAARVRVSRNSRQRGRSGGDGHADQSCVDRRSRQTSNG